ncbi:MAG: hypothetical protein LDL31_03790 [Prosthecobacter sp.]|nr:hypothetical protein [Prosthecobacter sp.]
MSALLPPARPKIDRPTVEQILRAHKTSATVAIIGRRGYYRDSMGQPGRNDRGIYDDALIVVSPTAFVTFNGNTDPSVHRKAIATLKPGVWSYKLGIHGLSKPKDQQYRALVQAAPVTVIRDQAGEETGWFGINIHRGGRTTTSSLGCQTIPPDQWPAFIALVEAEMKRHQVKEVKYVLVD